eukprot:2829340-Amphidinium_carterae.1
MSMTPTGIDQIVSMMTTLGFDASDMSLTDAQQLVATARARQTSLSASSSQGPQTTIDTLPEAPVGRAMDPDDIPLTLLLQPMLDEKSTDTARILATTSSVATPLPAPPTIPLTT